MTKSFTWLWLVALVDPDLMLKAGIVVLALLKLCRCKANNEEKRWAESQKQEPGAEED